MIVFRLVRIASLEEGTFGALKDNHGVPFAVTLEPMWRDNRTNVSCIAGDRQYMCSRTLSPTFGETFKVNRVTGRTNILFHKGNTAKDTRGCILVGQGSQQDIVYNSTLALELLLKEIINLGGTNINLTIKNK